MEILLLIGRILYGGFFFYNGLNHLLKNKMLSDYAGSKKVPSPRFLVFVSGLMILLGGVGIILGVYVQWSLVLITIFLVAVSFKMHAFWNLQDPMAKMSEKVNFLKNIALLGAGLIILAFPTPWPLSLF